MAEVKCVANSGPLEMRGSERWDLYQTSEEHKHFLSTKDASMYAFTIDMRLGPEGTLIGTGIHKNEDCEVFDIMGKWNNKTIEFTSQPRNESKMTTSYKGYWSEDFGTIRGDIMRNMYGRSLGHRMYLSGPSAPRGEFETKFEMKLESQDSVANACKQSENFCKNMANYYKNSSDKMFYDFHIVSRDGEKIQAHKFILGSQSEYFAALFRKESSDHVQLDYPGNTIRSGIDYLYAHKIDFTIDNVQDILAFSNYINLTDLEELASSFIMQNMDISNVCDVLMLSDFLANEPLKNASISFIAKNFHKLFRSNNDFLQIPKHLFKQIIGSKSLILYTNRGTIITGEEREYGILSLIKTYVDVHQIKDDIVTFLPYLRLNLTDEIREKIFSSLSMEITPFEVLSSEPRDYAFVWSTQSHKYLWGRAPNNAFREEKAFQAFGNTKKFINSIVIIEREWENTILVSGLKIDWSDGTTDIVGSKEGNQVKLEVSEGEHVVSVVGKAGWYVDSLGLITSSGKILGPAGGDGGDEKNPLSCLEENCEITKTFLDGISGCIVRTNTVPSILTVARLVFKFVTATNEVPKTPTIEIVKTDESDSEDSEDEDNNMASGTDESESDYMLSDMDDYD